jgi:hypothetical protein
MASRRTLGLTLTAFDTLLPVSIKTASNSLSNGHVSAHKQLSNAKKQTESKLSIYSKQTNCACAKFQMLWNFYCKNNGIIEKHTWARPEPTRLYAENMDNWIFGTFFGKYRPCCPPPPLVKKSCVRPCDQIVIIDLYWPFCAVCK